MTKARGVTRAARLVAALATAAAIGLLASACGGDSNGNGVAQVGSTKTTTTGSGSQKASSEQEAALKYAACMREHGVPKFPDPDANGGIAVKGGAGLDPSSPQYKAADEACKKLLPRGGKQADPKQKAKARGEALKYAACMRRNGVPKFPDPDANGAIAVKGGAGLDPSSPRYKAADQRCNKLLGGGVGGSLSSGGSDGTP
jgi:hypothetical protein